MKPWRWIKSLLFFCGWILVGLSPLRAEEVPLTLSECIRMAIQKNLSLSLQRFNPRIFESRVLAARGPFDLNFTTDHSYSETDSPSSNTRYTTSRSNEHSVGLDQRIPFGTTFSVDQVFGNSMSTSNEFKDNYSQSIEFSATQPLLRNLGSKINLFTFKNAEFDLLISEADYQTNVDRTVTDVANAFFELLFAIENLKNRQLSLEYAQKISTQNQSRFEIGVMTKLDVSQANSEVASRQEAVFRAEREIRTRQNTLVLLVSDDFESWITRVIRPLPDEVFSKTPPPLESAFKNAINNRPDLLRMKKVAEKDSLAFDYRKNQTLPQLDLSGTYGYNGLGGNPQRSIKDTAELNKDEWSIGVLLKIPFQNRSARGAEQEAKLQQQQGLLEIKQKEQQILSEVDNAMGQVNTNEKRVESTLEAQSFAKETLEAEQEKLFAGSSTTFTVLRLQRDFVEAQTNALRAKTDLEKSLAELHRVQGLSLIYAQETKKDPAVLNP